MGDPMEIDDTVGDAESQWSLATIGGRLRNTTCAMCKHTFPNIKEAIVTQTKSSLLNKGTYIVATVEASRDLIGLSTQAS